MNTERRSKTKRGILVAILLICIVAVIGGTYARYSSSATVNGRTAVGGLVGDNDVDGMCTVLEREGQVVVLAVANPLHETFELDPFGMGVRIEATAAGRIGCQVGGGDPQDGTAGFCHWFGRTPDRAGAARHRCDGVRYGARGWRRTARAARGQRAGSSARARGEEAGREGSFRTGAAVHGPHVHPTSGTAALSAHGDGAALRMHVHVRPSG